MRKNDIFGRFAFKAQFLGGVEDWLNPGDSAIVSPDGKMVVGPVRHEEKILQARIDFRQLRGPRWQLDVAGHYARPDVFSLTADRALRPMVRAAEAPPKPEEPPGEQ